MKTILITLLIIVGLLLMGLTGCGKENTPNFKNELIKLYESSDNLPWEKQEFEKLLGQEINRNLYFHTNDYMQIYIGQRVDYLVFESNKSDGLEYVFIWSPPRGSQYESTFSVMTSHGEEKIELNQAIGTLGENLNNISFDPEEETARFVTDSLLTNNSKFLYEGQLPVAEPSKPPSTDFSAKTEISNKIFQDIKELEYLGVEFTESLTVYIQDFNQYHGSTSVLLVPDGDLDNAIAVMRYNISEMELDIRTILSFANINLEENSETTREYLNFGNKMKNSAIKQEITKY